MSDRTLVLDSGYEVDWQSDIVKGSPERRKEVRDAIIGMMWSTFGQASHPLGRVNRHEYMAKYGGDLRSKSGLVPGHHPRAVAAVALKEDKDLAETYPDTEAGNDYTISYTIEVTPQVVENQAARVAE